jgi:hypothetical protein
MKASIDGEAFCGPSPQSGQDASLEIHAPGESARPASALQRGVLFVFSGRELRRLHHQEAGERRVFLLNRNDADQAMPPSHHL